MAFSYTEYTFHLIAGDRYEVFQYESFIPNSSYEVILDFGGSRETQYISKLYVYYSENMLNGNNITSVIKGDEKTGRCSGYISSFDLNDLDQDYNEIIINKDNTPPQYLRRGYFYFVFSLLSEVENAFYRLFSCL